MGITQGMYRRWEPHCCINKCGAGDAISEGHKEMYCLLGVITFFTPMYRALQKETRARDEQGRNAKLYL